jgi:hypothetical protein
MSNLNKYRNWQDPVGQLLRIRAALEILLSFRDNYRQRMEDATSVLANVRRETVPERIRPVINRIMDLRVSVRQDYGKEHTLFHFERLTPTQRKQLREDILKLYEACAFDLGAMGNHEFIYPKGEPSERKKRIRIRKS